MNFFTAFNESMLPAIVLIALFLAGYFESKVLKNNELAFVTWFTGLVALTAWIAYPMTTLRLIVGISVFVGGIIGMAIYDKRTHKEGQ